MGINIDPHARALHARTITEMHAQLPTTNCLARGWDPGLRASWQLGRAVTRERSRAYRAAARPRGLQGGTQGDAASARAPETDHAQHSRSAQRLQHISRRTLLSRTRTNQAGLPRSGADDPGSDAAARPVAAIRTTVATRDSAKKAPRGRTARPPRARVTPCLLVHPSGAEPPTTTPTGRSLRPGTSPSPKPLASASARHPTLVRQAAMAQRTSSVPRISGTSRVPAGKPVRLALGSSTARHRPALLSGSPSPL